MNLDKTENLLKDIENVKDQLLIIKKELLTMLNPRYDPILLSLTEMLDGCRAYLFIITEMLDGCRAYLFIIHDKINTQESSDINLQDETV